MNEEGKREPTVTAELGEKKIGMTEQLFPEKFVKPEAGEKLKQQEELPGPKGKTDEKATEDPSYKKSNSPERDEFDFESYQDRKIKIKADGVEEEITLGELRKRHQQTRTINKRFEQLAGMQKNIDEQRRELQGVIENLKRNPAQSPYPTEKFDDNEDTAYEELKKQNEKLLKEMESFRSVVTPVARERIKSDITERLKSEGFQDADQWYDKVFNHIREVSTTDYDKALRLVNMAEANNGEGAVSLYKELKLKELMSQKSEPNAAGQIKRPPVHKVDTGEGKPSTEVIDDLQAKKEEAKKFAIKTGNWGPYLKITGYGG
jgi:hypothetical protein